MDDKYIAIYRRFRPETFDEILGQEHVVRVLKNQIKDNKLGHAYLFSGTRGTGKTTMARILAKGAGCLSDVGERPCGICDNCKSIKDGTCVDVIEIDAASNNSVDDVRALRESIIYPPSTCRKKVFIIDEVHMFSTQAFNALLKTLEEPPEYIMFILCTTEPSKLPATILSRCLRFDFKRVSAQQIMKGMDKICAEMGIGLTSEAAALLAQNADGSVRDGLSILEQCVQAGEKELTRELVLEIVGSPSDERLATLSEAIYCGNTSEALLQLNEMLIEGMDESQIMKDWINWFHSALMIKFVSNPERIVNRSAENIESIKGQSAAYEVEYINNCIYKLSKLLNDTRWSSNKRILLEMTIIELSERKE